MSTTSTTSNDAPSGDGDGEVRWIESEAIQEEDRQRAAERQSKEGGGHDDDDDVVDGFSDMFADPDPLDTFCFDYELGRSAIDGDGSSSSKEEEAMATGASKVVHIRLSGHKAELGQTLHSTGLTLWRASELLCAYLVQTPNLIRGKHVLELGAGLGLCGILVHHMEAARVVLTDGDTDTLANLRSNVEMNCPAMADERTSAASGIECCQLVWGRNLEEFVQTHGTFDVILGADIIYREEILEPLWSSVAQLLQSAGVFLLAYARRNVSIDRVLETATKYGFVWDTPDEAEGVFLFSRLHSQSSSEEVV